MANDIVVSIYCTAYNHEKYIEKTLNGFINQKTDFKYQVIVHDDASTDRTAEIIKNMKLSTLMLFMQSIRKKSVLSR